MSRKHCKNISIRNLLWQTPDLAIFNNNHTEAFREVLNVVLAKLLNQRGSLTIPERIRRIATGQSINRRMPDVTIANYQAVCVIIEGRSDESASGEVSLTKDARRRMVEGIAAICIAVRYPSSIRHATSLEELENLLSNAILKVRVFNEAS